MSKESSLIIDQGIRCLLRSAEKSFVSETNLIPWEMPAGLSQLEGILDGNPLRLHTRRYRGTRLDSFTVAVLATDQQLCSFTAIGLPPPGAPWPVLGIDLIALRGAISLIAIDLAPTDLDFWERYCAPLLTELHTQVQDVVVRRKRPSFADSTFSPLALIAGVSVGKEEPVFIATETFLQQTMALLGRLPAFPYSRAAWMHRERWLTAEKQNRKEHNALERMFGSAVATRYLDEFLFAS